MFDFASAIADLDTRGLGYADDGHRSTMELAAQRLPELALPLGRISDILDDVAAWGNPAEMHEAKRDAEDEAQALYDVVEEAEARFAKLRDLALILARMSKPTEDDIKALAMIADEAQDYCMKRRDRARD